MTQMILVPEDLLATLQSEASSEGLDAIDDVMLRAPDPIGVHYFTPYDGWGLFEPPLICGHRGCGASQLHPVHLA